MSPYTFTDEFPDAEPLPPLLYVTATANPVAVYVHHLRLATAPPDLVALLHTEFVTELEIGFTYPQLGPISLDEFKAYFFARDVFVGIKAESGRIGEKVDVSDVEEARNGRDWSECILGAYYVKPNYPGRSSHICNAGFITLPASRSLGIGTLLGTSYVHNAPRLGYQASVFNLVYASNVASLRIWERLGFEKVGKVPGAGKKGDEYIDAWVIWKEF
ncbi:hypothetical protein BOTBODRAFT_101861 [Botryobasidium botryosum FD-172 SS1]|uniref:N-acetyltransferase domain-containing protein n=1 Tax=Botryobasidium botryosum (strain FD-172 SS1) TaxID=930990 RepID=A0A067MWM1_BOTB1|nr:hypothetical protein BOTBODRAFT_101861 [Botryobasidium botryosum FD-172 SS1]